MSKDRNRWEIIMDVLKAIQEGKKSKKTHIMQKAYLDYRRFDPYFSFLLEEGFIECTKDVCYRLTEKGEKLLKSLQDLDEIVGLKLGSSSFWARYSIPAAKHEPIVEITQ